MPRSSQAFTARIIVVDDDDDIREVSEIVLDRAGYSVRATGSGLEALRWLEEESCDLLIVDLRMPEIDGPALLREIHARWPTNGPHVLLVSGSSEPPYDPTTGEPILYPVLVKPFTLDDLRDSVAWTLDKGRRNDLHAQPWPA